MSIGPWWAEEDADDPALLGPDVDVAGLAEYELQADLREALEQQGREYARELEAVARWARLRPRERELSTAGGRGGPWVEARATADVVLADVAEDFVAELALSRDCSEFEAAALLRRCCGRRCCSPGR